MKCLTYTNGYHRIMYYISDDGLADAAYSKIKTAMVAFKEYGNDREMTVSFVDDSGEVTLRMSQLFEIAITALDDKSEAIIRERHAWSNRFKDLETPTVASKEPTEA